MDGSFPHSEGSRQGFVAPPVLWQAAAEEVGAVRLDQASGWRHAALVEERLCLLFVLLVVGR